MKLNLSGILLALLPTLAQAEAVNYKDVFIVDSHRIGRVLVRYIKLLSDECMTVQALTQNPKWEVVSSKSICSIEGKSLMNDVLDSAFEDIYFADDGVHFILSFTTQPLAAEQRRTCRIPVEQGIIMDLECSKPT